MRAAHGTFGLTAAAIASMAAMSPARAVEIDDVLGRWGDNGSAFECAALSGTETQSVEVEKTDKGFYVGAYAWGCMVDTVEHLGSRIGGAASCASEGDGESEPGHVELGLTDAGRLLVVDQAGEYELDRCAVQQ